MRLLNVNTLRFGIFYDVQIPPYAILSHTWAQEAGEEVSQHEFLELQAKRVTMSHNDSLKTTDHDIINTSETMKWPSGYRKILGFCDFVKRRRTFDHDSVRIKRPDAFASNDQQPRGTGLESLQWVWIDTCCIDASSSSEVSEAINSMWSWYFFAEECYVYLSDQKSVDCLTHSRWFTRGWTLQELLASRTRIFCSADWKVLGYIKTKWSTTEPDLYDVQDLTTVVCERTGIPRSYLSGERSLRVASVAERLSWAVDRHTTRIEDRFYSLLGLLDVRIAPMYGEGRKAFFRLQEEIIRTSGDLSIFFWKYIAEDIPDGVHPDRRTPVGLLAPHLGCFRASSNVVKWQAQPGYHFTCKNVGVKLWVQRSEVLATSKLNMDDNKVLVIILGGWDSTIKKYTAEEQLNTIALLACTHDGNHRYYRSRCNDLVNVGKIHLTLPCNLTPSYTQSKIYVEKECSVQDQKDQCMACYGVDETLISRVKHILSQAR